MNAPSRIAPLLAASVAALAAACGGGGGGGGACDRVTLASAAQDVALPTGYPTGAFPAITNLPSCVADGAPAYALLDLTGDDRPDLVVTRLCGDPSVGSTRWIVHPGGDGGFGAATSWTLPGGYPAGSFPALTGTPGCAAAGAVAYALADLTGDGRPDLVITRRCGDATVGDTRWIVHASTGSGFGDATTWDLPTGYPTGSFPALSAEPSCAAAGAVTYVLADLTGDGHPDLVGTHLCGDATVGDTRWIVHAGGDHGFGAAATWQLPTGYPAGSFPSTTGEAGCTVAGQPAFTTTDVDGDRRPDLVVTSLCGDATVGDSHWIVHRGQGDGFGAAAPWSLPAGYPNGSFTRTSAARTCIVDAAPVYATVDATGDGVADLLVTALCGDATVGDTRWLVHAGGPDGFAPTADDLPLPAGYPTGAFRATAAEPTCVAAGAPTYVLTDLDGDGRPDLVVTRVCGDATVGDTRWLVHTSTCAP